MKSETLIVYNKYNYFLFVLSNERFNLFTIHDNALDYDTFFDLYNDVVCWHKIIRPLYRNFNKRRSEIIKKFEYEKYMILLRSRFNYDIYTEIMGFIC